MTHDDDARMADARMAGARMDDELRGAAPAPDGFLEAVMARVRAAEPPRRRGRLRSLPLRLAAAAAAALLIALAALTPPERPIPLAGTPIGRPGDRLAVADVVRRARLLAAQVGRAPDDVLALDLAASGLAHVDPDARELAALSSGDRRLVRGVALAARAARNGAPVGALELRGLGR